MQLCSVTAAFILLCVTSVCPWYKLSTPLESLTLTPGDWCRAAKELYVAEIDGKVLVKIGAKSYEPEDAAWRPADKGKAWALWLR